MRGLLSEGPVFLSEGIAVVWMRVRYCNKTSFIHISKAILSQIFASGGFDLRKISQVMQCQPSKTGYPGYSGILRGSQGLSDGILKIYI